MRDLNHRPATYFAREKTPRLAQEWVQPTTGGWDQKSAVTPASPTETAGDAPQGVQGDSPVGEFHYRFNTLRAFCR
jgi:hypothetical protein